MSALVRVDEYTQAERSRARAWVELMVPAVELAKSIATTDFVPRALRNNPAAISAAILYGDEVGLGPMQSLAKIAVIDGRPFIAAEAQRGLVLAAGHELWLDEATNTRVTWSGRRHGSDQVTRITWTMDDARRAHLDGKPNWRSYPRQMLSARASAELVRATFADVVGGLGAIEEYDDTFDTNIAGDVRTTTSTAADETAGRRRRVRRPAPTPTAAPVAETAGIVAATPPAAIGDVVRPPLPGEVDDETDTPSDPGIDGALTLQPSTSTSPEPLSNSQRNRIMGLFRQRGVTGEGSRKARLQLMGDWIGRPISSGNELTRQEADRVLDCLETMRDVAADLDEPELEPVDEDDHPDNVTVQGEIL